MLSKHLLIIFVLVTVVASCHKRVAYPAPAPPPARVTVVVPVTGPAPVLMSIPSALPAPAGARLFEYAELAYANGDYGAAIEGYEDYLRFVPNGERTDQVLFHVGMSYVLRMQPPPNWRRATATLQQLIEEHPDSPFKSTASLILSLHSDADQLASDAKARNEVVQQLKTQLERLKKIDADRLKHP